MTDDRPVNAFVKSMRAWAAPTILTLRHATDGHQWVKGEEPDMSRAVAWELISSHKPPDKSSGR